MKGSGLGLGLARHELEVDASPQLRARVSLSLTLTLTLTLALALTNYVTNRVSCVKSYAYTCRSHSKSVQTYVFLVREHAHEHVW